MSDWEYTWANGDLEYTWPKNMLLLDRTKEPANLDISYPFALDELLCKQTGEGGPAICHLWQHPRAFVMGSRDSRLPGAPNAVRWLENEGYEVLVRNSGGAAVPLDMGVMNISLIMPISAKYAHGFRDDFERMYHLLHQTVASFGYKVDKGEVIGSYCPGDYDLQIDGLKFCGIAQRRKVSAVIIQAFIIVEGSGTARAELVKAFYERAGVGAESTTYPHVLPHTMSSLQERSVVGMDGVQSFNDAVSQTLGQFTGDLKGDLKGALQESSQVQGSLNGRPSATGLLLPDPALIKEMSNRIRQR